MLPIQYMLAWVYPASNKVMNSILTNLNPAQQAAVTTKNGPLLVIAGAGSGKTRVLVHRIAYLIASDVRPDNILAVTFTNKAAGEIKERIKQLTADYGLRVAGFEPWVGTFHALGVYILRKDGHAIGIPRSFTILDEDDAISVVKRIIKERKLDPKQYAPSRIRHTISALKNMPFQSAEHEDEQPGEYPKEVREIRRQYEEELARARALDFDDLLLRALELLRTQPDILRAWQERWPYVLIDEYQDTNRIQYELSKLLAQRYGNIMVVGDVDQAIYSWRGADFRNILAFEQDWPNTKVITLEQNYRSTSTILHAANTVIQKNKERKEKKLWTSRAEGPLIELAVAENERHEADFVTREILNLRGREHAPLKEMAVLYRTNAQSRALEEAFIKQGIPYRLVGGVRFYERREIKDVLAYLRLAANKNNSISLRRIINTPPRGIGAVLAEKYFTSQPLTARERQRIHSFQTIIAALEEAYAMLPPSEFARMAILKSGYEDYIRDGTPEGEDRWANVEELGTVTQAHDPLGPKQGTDAFLEEAALLSDADTVDKSADAVHIMTIHAAKGLEFENVFVTGLEEGIFPHSLSMRDSLQMEEERRLCYVALTRARTRLYISTAQTRTLYGETIWSEPSRFLKDIPKHLIAERIQPEFETNYID
jgi:DNA helicase II / ATP-dependent DNA helicase PcrA